MEQLLHFETHKKSSNKKWILLVHGAGGSTRTWKRQIDQLGETFNLVVVDLIGHGKNVNKKFEESTYTFKSIANRIWDVVDYLEISKIHLIGISLGTILCLQMRLLRPQSVLSVIMPGAIVKLNPKLRILARISLTFAKIIGYRNFYKLSAYIMMPRGNHKKSRDVFIKESKVLTEDEFRKWTDLYYHLNHTLNLFFQAPSSIPQLLIMGSQDHLFLNPAKAYAKLHDNSSIAVIPNCGHVVSIEKAAKFNQLCLSFLKGI